MHIYKNGGIIYMKRKSKHALIGAVLLIVSIFVTIFNLRFFSASFGNLWPALLLLVGIFFYLYYFSTKKKKNRPAVLFLGTFVAISSVFIFILSFTSYDYMRVLWPGFFFALGMGVLSLYFYGKKKKSALAFSIVLLSLSILIWIFYALKSKFGLPIGITLFILGAAFLTRGLIKEAKKPEVEHAEEPQKGDEEITVPDFENFE